MNVPCSSGLKPGWILHAFEIDRVFIASDGDETTDCCWFTRCRLDDGLRLSAE